MKQFREINHPPGLPKGLKFKAIGYLFGNCVRKRNDLVLSNFKEVEYLGQSGNYHHILADGSILVCVINF